MGPNKLAKKAGIPLTQARQLVKDYWINFPKVKAYFDNFVRASVNAKCIRSPYDNRLRWLDGFDYDSPKDSSRVRNMCMNFPMQSGNASITKLALVWLRRDLSGKDAKLISTIHDKICCV